MIAATGQARSVDAVHEPAASVIFAFARMGEMGRASALSLLLIGAVLAALGLLWTVARRSGRLALGTAR